MRNTIPAIALIAAATAALPALGGGNHALDQPGAVLSDPAPDQAAAFDILAAHVHREGRFLTFHMTTRAGAGEETPTPVGSLASAPAYTYVWPTSLDPSSVGFQAGSGILALVAASHPDFDDTPLFDETADGDPNNDGGHWHSHWVVLHGNEDCGPGALAVRDIPEGSAPKVPATWPGLPLFLDSPGYSPIFDGQEVKITIALDEAALTEGLSYDGVTSALMVNADVHAPLFCVTNVFDIASGDLSLPGRLDN